jgi:hypothetical protein
VVGRFGTSPAAASDRSDLPNPCSASPSPLDHGCHAFSGGREHQNVSTPFHRTSRLSVVSEPAADDEDVRGQRSALLEAFEAQVERNGPSVSERDG